MKKSILILICTYFICTLSLAQNKATSPKIISTNPDFGNCKVDPDTKEIILKFDQDMKPGMSVIDSKNMPQIIGKPQWIDKRTFSIQVKLFPNRLYSLVFNNSRFQGFQNTEGVPLNPDMLLFQTKAVSFAAVNKQAYKDLVEIFPKKYSYASIKWIDWGSLLSKSQSEFENAETPIEFSLKLIKLLRPAVDPHLWIEVEGQRFETFNLPIVENNFLSGPIFTLLKDRTTGSNFTFTSGVCDSIGYMSFRNWNIDFDSLSIKSWGNSNNPLLIPSEVLKGLLRYPNLIIDVRENTGGNESFAKNFASRFISDSVAYEKIKVYNDKSGNFDKEIIKRIFPSKNNIKYTGKIYVLSGPAVMSSNESFILMMKQVPNSKIVGMKSFGSSGNPVPIELSNGIKIYLPSWQAYTLEGKLIEGNGINPDIEIITTKDDFQKKDGLFEKAVNMIKTK